MLMKVKRGKIWLQHKFKEQLTVALNHNHVVDLNEMVNFEDRDEFITDMIIRGDIEEATQSDINRQDRINKQRKEDSMKEANHLNQLEQEEADLKKIMGL